MANIAFPRQILYIAAATIGAKLGWEFASDYNMFVKIKILKIRNLTT